MKRKVFVTFQREGIHKWPEAITIPGIEFLANPHRHMFHFRIEMDVEHNDREVEFILFKRWIESLYSDKILELENHSCEMMAEELIGIIQKKYPGRDIKIEVSEDGENGAILEYQCHKFAKEV